MGGLPHPSYWKLPRGKDSVSLKPGLLEAHVLTPLGPLPSLGWLPEAPR